MKGEFTGAVRNKAGLWEEAQGGTLFLDEVGDLALRHQVKILRAMDENPKIRRIGDHIRERPVDARIIAATNCDLFSMVRSGRFREDLYYRLRGFTINTFPLRDHPEDIALLARHFWRRIAGDKATLSQAVLDELAAYSWPGNVRDLKFILASLAGYYGTTHLEAKHLREVMRYHGHISGGNKGPLAKWAFDLHQVESLRHLNKADETICAAKAALRPLVDRNPEKDADPTTAIAALGQRVQDLDILCLHPLRFNSEDTFETISRLREKLAYFRELASANRREAILFWKTELTGEFKQSCSAVFDEVERLKKQE